MYKPEPNFETVTDIWIYLTGMKPPKPGIRDLPVEERREYQRQKKAEQRAKRKAALESGSPVASADTIREALADAALAILSTDAPGSEQIRSVLNRVFPDRPSVAVTVSAKAKSGKLKPKLLKK